MKEGTAMLASVPMIATTIMISTRVNPTDRTRPIQHRFLGKRGSVAAGPTSARRPEPDRSGFSLRQTWLIPPAAALVSELNGENLFHHRVFVKRRAMP